MNTIAVHGNRSSNPIEAPHLSDVDIMANQDGIIDGWRVLRLIVFILPMSIPSVLSDAGPCCQNHAQIGEYVRDHRYGQALTPAV